MEVAGIPARGSARCASVAVCPCAADRISWSTARARNEYAVAKVGSGSPPLAPGIPCGRAPRRSPGRQRCRRRRPLDHCHCHCDYRCHCHVERRMQGRSAEGRRRGERTWQWARRAAAGRTDDRNGSGSLLPRLRPVQRHRGSEDRAAPQKAIRFAAHVRWRDRNSLFCEPNMCQLGSGFTDTGQLAWAAPRQASERSDALRRVRLASKINPPPARTSRPARPRLESISGAPKVPVPPPPPPPCGDVGTDTPPRGAFAPAAWAVI
jgi:hypothetical protein